MFGSPPALDAGNLVGSNPTSLIGQYFILSAISNTEVKMLPVLRSRFSSDIDRLMEDL